MSDDNHADDPVIDDVSNSASASAQSNSIAAAAHDQNTIFQQNNSQQNEIIQSLIESRRQEVAQFEQRMVQSNTLFANLMTQVLSNADAKSARDSGLQTQQQTYNNSQAAQSRAQATAEMYASLGILTIIP